MAIHRRRATTACFTLALAAALLAAPLSSFAVSHADADAARAKAAAAKRKQATAQAQADRLVAETQKLETTISKTRGQLQTINGKVSGVESRREKLEAEMAGLRTEVAKRQSAIASTTAAYEQRRHLLDERVVAVYRQGDLFYLQVLLDSRDLSDFITRTAFVQRVMVEDRSIMGELTESRMSLDRAKLGLDRSLQELAAKRSEVAAQEDELRQLQSDRAAQLTEQRSAQSVKSTLLAETKQNIANLRVSIAAEEAEAARIESMLRKSASHGSGHAAAMTWPAPGHHTITSPFGWRVHPILHTRKFHSGIDIAAPEGARIVAAGSGTVIFAGDRGGYGNCTMIDHGNGVVSVYAHQSEIDVSEGDHVSRGQTIGAVGSTGMSTGPHLHFEVRVNGDPRDPMGYL